MPWEGVEAELEGITLHAFKLEDYGIPYGYSPVIARNAQDSKLSDAVTTKFIEATLEGYEFAIKNADEAAALLSKYCDPPKTEEFLRRSQASINYYYSDGTKLGIMEQKKWATWLSWLEGKGMLKASEIDEESLFSNVFYASIGGA